MLIAHLIRVADAYCRAADLSRSRVATIIFNDGKKIDLLASGADLNTRSFERAMLWLSENWPKDAPWPEDVPRPQRPATVPDTGAAA